MSSNYDIHNHAWPEAVGYHSSQNSQYILSSYASDPSYAPSSLYASSSSYTPSHSYAPSLHYVPSPHYVPNSQIIHDIVVPQRPYAANVQRNHNRTIETILYNVNGARGISLRDAQSHNFRGLAQAEDRPLHGFGVKVTYRIEWPGYGSFNKQKHALRATQQKEAVTRAKMAVHVAEVMKDFIEEMEGMHTTEPAWRVGSGYITLDDLYLLEIHQVARASLQPVIAYRPRVWGPVV